MDKMSPEEPGPCTPRWRAGNGVQPPRRQVDNHRIVFPVLLGFVHIYHFKPGTENM